jgi:hypothetical protein
MPTPQAHYDRILSHYVTLAACPGFKKYVWARVQQMAKDCPELYASLPADLIKHMTNKETK